MKMKNGILNKRKILAVLMALILILGLVAAVPKPVKAATNLDAKWTECVETWKGNTALKNGWTESGKTPWIASNPTEWVGITGGSGGEWGYHVYNARQLRYALLQAVPVSTTAISIYIEDNMDLGGRTSQNWAGIGLESPLNIYGKGHTIYNLYASSAGDYVGFINFTDENLNIEQLNFQSAQIEGTRYVGVIGSVTDPEADGVISVLSMNDCSFEQALIKGTGYIGTIVGQALDFHANQWKGNVDIVNTRVKNSYVRGGNASTGYCTGNFIGPASGTIKNSYAIDGVVLAGGGHSGAFMSCGGPHNVENCFTNVSIYGNTAVGAFIGNEEGQTGYNNAPASTYKNCYSSGLVEGKVGVGGFLGVHDPLRAQVKFENCYTTAMVGMDDGGTNLGGFMGKTNGGAIQYTNCYSAGEVGSLETQLGVNTVGGFAGSYVAGDNCTNCYYDKQTTATDQYGIVGLTGNYPGQLEGKTTKVLTGMNGTVPGFDTSYYGAWTTEKGMYPQLKVFADPINTGGFMAKDAAVVKAFSLASASTVFLRDETTSGSTNYDTVRNIREPFNFTSKAKNNAYDFSWEVDPDHYDVGKKDIFSTVITNPATPVLSFSSELKGKDDRVVNMAPGKGWAKVTASFVDNYSGSPTKGQKVTGNRALRIIPTTTMSLGTATPDMGIGSDFRIYPDNPDLDKGQPIIKYDHRIGTTFVEISAAEIARGEAGGKTPYPAGTPEASYKNNVVLKYANNTTKAEGVVTVTIAKNNLDGTLASSNVVPDGDSSESTKRYRRLFAGAENFTNQDYGVYTLNYTWTLNDGSVKKSSKKVYILPTVGITYQWNVPAGAVDYDNYNGITEDNTDKSIIDVYGNDPEEKELKIDKTLKEKGVALPKPTRPGYQFVGWATKEGATPEDYIKMGDDAVAFGETTKLTSALLGTDNKLSVYAVWKIRSYDVSFIYPAANTGTVKGVAYATALGSQFPSAPAINDVDTDKKIFLGWSTIDTANPPKDAEGKDIPQVENFKADTLITNTDVPYYNYFEKETDNKNTTINIYPILRNNEGTVQFYKNDGTGEDGKGDLLNTDQKLSYNTVITAPEAPTWEGYSFVGFSDTQNAVLTAEEAQNFVGADTIGKIYDGVKDTHTYYAAWTKNPFTLEAYWPGAEDPTKPFEVKTDIAYDDTALGDRLPTAPEFWTDENGEKWAFAGYVDENGKAVDNKTVVKVGDLTNDVLKVTAMYTNKTYDLEVSFYKNDGTEEKNPYNKVTGLSFGSTVTADKMIEPTRTGGYSFECWNTAADGKGETFTTDTAVKTSMNVYAKWTKDPFDLDVFMPWDKNPADPSHTVTDIPYDEALGDKLPPAPPYWTDDNGQKWEFTGYVDESGNPVDKNTVIKPGDPNFKDDEGKITGTYNQKVYDVTANKIGHGSITGGTGTFKEGDNTAVSWKADVGYKVSKVTVNGKVRDDLLGKGVVVFTGIDKDYTVNITFDKDDDGEQTAWYKVTTIKQGSEKAELTPTETVLAGKDHTVLWKAAEGEKVTRITVDGTAWPVSYSGSIPFEKIGSDHTVVVTFENINGLDGGTTPGFYTITTSQLGGDPKGVSTNVTGTSVVNKNSDHTVSWRAEDGYSIDCIIIDDKDTENRIVLTREEIENGSYDFKAVGRDHTVDVIFRAPEGSPAPDESCKVITRLIGGPGEITSSAEIPKGEDFNVSWSLPESIKDPDSTEYNHYVVDEVYVNGEKKGADIQEETLKNITEDQRVVVVLRPNVFTVETAKGGEGSIDPSKTMFYGDSYAVKAQPADGWYLSKVMVDGEVKEQFDDPSKAKNPVAALFKERVVRAESQDVIVDKETDRVNASFKKIEQNHKIKVVFAKKGEAEVPDDQMIDVSARIEGGPGTIVGGGLFTKGQSTKVQWTDIPENFVIDTIIVKIGGVEQGNITPTGNAIDLNDLQDNYEIIVKIKHGDGGEDPGIETGKINIATDIQGAPGASITPSLFNQAAGISPDVIWNYDHDRYCIKAVILDGVELEALKNESHYQFSNVQSNRSIVVILGEKEAPSEPDPGQFTITTSVGNSIGGTIDPGGVVTGGETKTITWQAAEGYETITVIVNGVVRDDLRKMGDAGSVTFSNINENNSVVVIYGKKDSGDVKPEHFVVETEIEGKGEITKTTVLKAGSDHEVVFKSAEGYKVVRIEVDGVLCNEYIAAGKISFVDLSENHKVNVIFEEEDTIPPVVEHVHVQVNVTGGPGTVTESGIINKGGSYTVETKPDSGYHVEMIYVDGKPRPDLIRPDGSFTLDNIESDTVIDVVFAKDKPVDNGDGDDNNGGNESNGGNENNGGSGNNTGADGLPSIEDLRKPPFDTTKVNIGKVAPNTGMYGDISKRVAKNSDNKALNESLFGNLLGAGAGGAADTFGNKGSAMALLDLLSTAVAVAMMICSFFFKKRAKWAALVITVLLGLLFLVTQPMVFKFVLMDIYTPLFLLLVCAESIIVLLMGKKEREKEEEKMEMEKNS